MLKLVLSDWNVKKNSGMLAQKKQLNVLVQRFGYIWIES